ncbi:MAG TPA: hypothetical protein VEJ63_11315 [Planctomycetota bacterium]|nr:hypothetical protein [Planctomycetota bacterium]
MERTLREDDGRMYGASSIVERRKLNWSAIVAGVVATLGLQVLMMYLGAALGLSVIDPYAPATGNTADYAWPILYLVLTALLSGFFGAWVAGHWANLYDAEDALMHGALTWALGAVVIAAGLGTMMQMGLNTAQTGAQTAQAAAQLGANPREGQAAANNFGSALTFSSLDDERFTSFVLNRAKSFEQSNAGRDEAVNVTTDEKKKADDNRVVKPEDVEDNDELLAFLTSQTNMNEDQAEKFLETEKESIAKAQQESHDRWQRAHARELAQAERAREAASKAAWTWTGLALLSLAAALGGSYLGWRQRYADDDDDFVAETDTTKESGTL